MVNTRSQNVDSYAACSSGMEQNSDNESEYSFPNTLSRNQINEFENGDLINVRQNSSSNSVDQRFMEMNKQISELTNIVLALTEKISSPMTECGGLNTVINTNVTRSDKELLITGVTRNLQKCSVLLGRSNQRNPLNNKIIKISPSLSKF